MPPPSLQSTGADGRRSVSIDAFAGSLKRHSKRGDAACKQQSVSPQLTEPMLWAAGCRCHPPLSGCGLSPALGLLLLQKLRQWWRMWQGALSTAAFIPDTECGIAGGCPHIHTSAGLGRRTALCHATAPRHTAHPSSPTVTRWLGSSSAERVCSPVWRIEIAYLKPTGASKLRHA